MNDFARTLIFFGVILIAAGLAFGLLGKTGLGRLPGDVYVRKGNFTFYFPLTTSIVLSLLLTLFFTLFGKK